MIRKPFQSQTILLRAITQARSLLRRKRWFVAGLFEVFSESSKRPNCMSYGRVRYAGFENLSSFVVAMKIAAIHGFGMETTTENIDVLGGDVDRR